MKKIYTQPTIEVEVLQQEDVITTSGVANKLGGLLPGDKEIDW